MVGRWGPGFGERRARLDGGGERGLERGVSDRTGRERAKVGLHERLIAHRGQRGELRLAAGFLVSGGVVDAGADWLLLDDPGHRSPGAQGRAGDQRSLATFGSSLIPFGAIVAITGLGTRSAAGPGVATAKRFGLGYALRGLSRDRSVVSLTDIAGSVTTGTIDGVGADALDLSEHPADVARRSMNVLARRVIPFTAIVVVRNS